jgi:23S rRNA (pseudouridine1915-N3)-methyltransferase
MKLRVIWVGAIGDASIRRLADRYSDRIRQFFPLEIVEVRAVRTRSMSDAEIIREESNRLHGALPDQGHVIVLDERGKQFDSIEFGAWLEKQTVHNPHGITFVMGGDLGLSEEIRSRGDKVVALSRMTLPHEIARLVLLEQVYRACTIIRHVPYHK